MQHQATPACTDDKVDLISQEKDHLYVAASQCNPVQMASMPPLGQLQSAVSSVIHDILDSDCAESNSLEALKQTLASLSNDTLLETLLSALKTK